MRTVSRFYALLELYSGVRKQKEGFAKFCGSIFESAGAQEKMDGIGLLGRIRGIRALRLGNRFSPSRWMYIEGCVPRVNSSYPHSYIQSNLFN